MTMVQEPPARLDEDDELDVEERADAPPPEPPDDDDAAPFDRWRSQLPTALVVVLAVLVAGGAFVLYRQNEDLRAERDDRREAAEVASQFTTAVLSYDHRDLQGSLDAVLAVSTRDWGRQYEDAWFQDQQQIVEELRARGAIEIDDVMVGEAANGVLPVVVTFNATIRSTIGTRRLDGSYLRLDMTKVEGDWLVDDMTYLANGQQSLEPGAGGGNGGDPPTATTAP